MLLPGGALRAEETLETLRTGSEVYSNVTVTSKTKTDIFIRHASGFANIKLKDLEPDVLAQLGYEIAPEARKRRGMSTPSIEMDPRVKEIQAKMSQEVEQNIQEIRQLDPRVLWGVIAGSVLFYLFFCFCCKLIVEKTGHETGAMIWIPILQVFPLFRAANMSGWWIVLVFIPGLNLVASIVWCIKITQARGKNVLVALLLILPFTNLFAFLYLAFSNGLGAKEELGNLNPNYISFR